MKLRYFVVDQAGQVTSVPQALAEDAWFGRRPLPDLPGRQTLEIICVICNDQLVPQVAYFVRVKAVDGTITRESIGDALYAKLLELPQIGVEEPDPALRRDPSLTFQHQVICGTPEVRHQLAVALDVTHDQIGPIYFGGPLIVADRLSVSVRQALTYMEDFPDDQLQRVMSRRADTGQPAFSDW